MFPMNSKFALAGSSVHFASSIRRRPEGPAGLLLVRYGAGSGSAEPAAHARRSRRHNAT